MKRWLVTGWAPAINCYGVAWAVQAESQDQAIELILADDADTGILTALRLPADTDLRTFVRSLDWEEVAPDQPRVLLTLARDD